MYVSPDEQIRDSAPRIGEWFSESFSLFGREWKVWSLQGLIALLVSGLPMIPGMIAYFGLFFRMMANTTPGSSGPTPTDMAAMFTAIGSVYGGACVSGLLNIFLLIGMSKTAMKQVRGEAISVGDLFSGGSAFLPVLGAYILAVLGTYVGFFLCVVPGLMLMGLWTFVHPLIVERRMGVFDAFRTSWEVTRPHLWSYVGWAFLIFVVYMMGAYTGCGAVATMPIALLMMMVSYRDVFERPAGFMPDTAQGTVAPPVYYGPAGPPAAGGSCPACGRLVAAGAVVCTSCGASLMGDPGAPPPPSG